DNYYASRALTEKLLKAGSHRPGFLGVIDADVAAGAMRRQGFEKALREGKLLKKDVSEKVCAFNEQSGYEKMREMLEEDYKPDGVICATDNIAAGAMRAIREAGLRIPDDVKIAAFGDTRLAALVSPAMTTVHFYYEKSGQEAGQMIMDMIRRPDDPVKKVLLEYEIVSRDSL
ncbi:MAG: trehalose repressor, partial [Catenibacillus sp.]